MEDRLLSLRPTLARRVSDLFKDGNSNSHLLLTQKLRHCCQNLNLFPYLLYSMGDMKTTTQKLTINQFIKNITDRLFQLYLNLRLVVHSQLPKATVTNSGERQKVQQQQEKTKVFTPDKKTKPQISLILILAVYLAPFIIICQLIGIFSLLIFGKYTPGFIFLLSALFFLGYISVKVLFHDGHRKIERKSRTKRKIE